MTTLEVRPTKKLSWSFDIYESEIFLTNITLGRSESKSESQSGFEYKETPYQIIREPSWGAFVLSDPSGEICRAVKPSAMFRSFEVTYGDETWVFKAAFPLSSSFDLLKADELLGRVNAKGIFTKRAITKFPDELPLDVQFFLIWLVVIIWRRDDNVPSPVIPVV